MQQINYKLLICRYIYGVGGISKYLRAAAQRQARNNPVTAGYLLRVSIANSGTS